MLAIFGIGDQAQKSWLRRVQHDRALLDRHGLPALIVAQQNRLPYPRATRCRGNQHIGGRHAEHPLPRNQTISPMAGRRRDKATILRRKP